MGCRPAAGDREGGWTSRRPSGAEGGRRMNKSQDELDAIIAEMRKISAAALMGQAMKSPTETVSMILACCPQKGGGEHLIMGGIFAVADPVLAKLVLGQVSSYLLRKGFHATEPKVLPPNGSIH